MIAYPFTCSLPQEREKAQTLMALARYAVPAGLGVVSVRSLVARPFYCRPVTLSALADQHGSCDMLVSSQDHMSLLAGCAWWDNMVIWSPSGDAVQFVILCHGEEANRANG